MNLKKKSTTNKSQNQNLIFNAILQLGVEEILKLGVSREKITNVGWVSI